MLIGIDVGNSLFKITSDFLVAPKELWNHLIIHCIDYLEISYSVCSLIGKRYSDKASEIAKLILKNNF